VNAVFSSHRTAHNLLKILSPHRAINTLAFVYKTNQLILYKKVIAFCSDIHAATHKYTVFGAEGYVAPLAEVMRHKLEGRGFDCR
jgi:hypothetical protein